MMQPPWRACRSANTHRDKQHQARLFDDLLSFGVQSVIVVSSRYDERHLEDALARDLEVVIYDRSTLPASIHRK